MRVCVRESVCVQVRVCVYMRERECVYTPMEAIKPIGGEEI